MHNALNSDNWDSVWIWTRIVFISVEAHRVVLEEKSNYFNSYINASFIPVRLKFKLWGWKDCRVSRLGRQFPLSRLVLRKQGTKRLCRIIENWLVLQGLHSKREFIVTQYPSANTMADFWQLIVEQRVHLIVLLHDPTTDEHKVYNH